MRLTRPTGERSLGAFTRKCGCRRLRIAGACLCKALKHGRKVRSVDPLERAFIAREREHRTRDFVLRIGRESAHGFKCFVEKFGHRAKMEESRVKPWKRGLLYCDVFVATVRVG